MSTELEIEENFKKDFGGLRGLKIHGLSDRFGEIVISVSHPFIFDSRQLPKEYKGFRVHTGIPEDELPKEFQIKGFWGGYVWAYQRYENFIDRCIDQIREELKNPNLTKEDALDAFCPGNDFKAWVEQCKIWERQGVIPKYSEEKIISVPKI